MKRRDDRVYLRDILDCIAQIESYLAGVNYESFCQDTMRRDAIVRRIEIIGEAARQLSSNFRDQHSEIPWSDVVGMRNKIIHDYFDVDWQTVWDTAIDDLPPLKDAVTRILEEP